MKTVFLLCASLSALWLVPLEGTDLFVKPGMYTTINCGVSIKNQDVEWTYGDKRSLIRRIKGKTGSLTKGKFPNIKVKRSGEHLELQSVGGEHVGLYICKVDGVEHRHMLYIVTASVSPSSDVPLGTSASLHCQVSGEPTPQVEWLRPGGGLADSSSGHVVLNSTTLEDTGIWTCRISKDDVIHRETVNIRVQSSKPTIPPSISRTVSIPQCLHCDTVFQPGHTDGGEVGGSPEVGQSLWGLSLWVWVAAGAGGLVLVLLVVLVVLLQRRNRRMKRRVQKLRIVRQPLKPNEYCQCTKPTRPPANGRPREKPSPVAKQQRLTGRST